MNYCSIDGIPFLSISKGQVIGEIETFENVFILIVKHKIRLIECALLKQRNKVFYDIVRKKHSFN